MLGIVLCALNVCVCVCLCVLLQSCVCACIHCLPRAPCHPHATEGRACQGLDKRWWKWQAGCQACTRAWEPVCV